MNAENEVITWVFVCLMLGSGELDVYQKKKKKANGFYGF